MTINRHDNPRVLLDFASRYHVFTNDQAARFLGVSAEAARSQARRLKRRSLLTGRLAFGRQAYWCLTHQGRQRMGVTTKEPRSGRALYEALGIADFFSGRDSQLLLRHELVEIFDTLMQHANLDLDVRGIPRQRFYWRTTQELSRVVVDLVLPGKYSASQYVKRLAEKRRTLQSKSQGWNQLLDSGGFSFTVLSPVDRQHDLVSHAAAAGIRVHSVHIPILAYAWGVTNAI